MKAAMSVVAIHTVVAKELTTTILRVVYHLTAH